MVMARKPCPSRSAVFRSLAGEPREALRVEARGGAQAVGRVEVDDDHLDRPVGLGLQLEAALELQGRAEEHRERRSLAERAGHGIRIAVARQNGVDRGAEPHDPAAHVQRLDGEGQNDVVLSLERGGRSCAYRSQAPGENALLRVEAVLGLVEDHRLRTVHDLVRHLLAAMGGQAMHEDGIACRPPPISALLT